jgi:hypothetical protein
VTQICSHHFSYICTLHESIWCTIDKFLSWLRLSLRSSSFTSSSIAQRGRQRLSLFLLFKYIIIVFTIGNDCTHQKHITYLCSVNKNMATLVPMFLKNDIMHSRKVKQEGEHGHCTGFAIPLYSKVSELRDGWPLFTKDFVEKYDMCCESLRPKHIKIPRDLTTKDVTKVFGLVVNWNGCNYLHYEDIVLITKIETLFMIVHQKACVLATQLISFRWQEALFMSKN